MVERPVSWPVHRALRVQLGGTYAARLVEIPLGSGRSVPATSPGDEEALRFSCEALLGRPPSSSGEEPDGTGDEEGAGEGETGTVSKRPDEVCALWVGEGNIDSIGI